MPMDAIMAGGPGTVAEPGIGMDDVHPSLTPVFVSAQYTQNMIFSV